MSRIAVFIDAGYLYAAGSVAITGTTLRRNEVELRRAETIEKLRTAARDRVPGATLLRIYWYDGVPPTGPSGVQQSLADMDDVKLRLGIINPSGQQKGVDSLIVTDMVELARNRAITDAILMSGDEDVRIGVQIAQSFGVRVHLLGIEPSRGNQARSLRQESDTTAEWSKTDIAQILTVASHINVSPISRAGAETPAVDTYAALDLVVDEFVKSRSRHDLTQIDLAPGSRLPRSLDAPLIAIASRQISRDLTEDEKRHLRRRLREHTAALSQPD